MPQLSPEFPPTPSAYKTARLNETSPVPSAGAVQSAVHERAPSLLCVSSPLTVFTRLPRFDHVPADASRLNPPWPAAVPLPVHEIEYVVPGVYWDGKPVIEGWIPPPPPLWQPHPFVEPVLPEELASIEGIIINNMATMSTLAILVRRDIFLPNRFTY